MGSNGIRFSITSLQPPTGRIMPTLYQQRTAISLYDAQYSAEGERVPIDKKTISAVVSSFERFKITCSDFGVQESNITVLATEATRTAINSEEFRGRIKDAVGWNVTMLSKEDEGRVGAMGVASSLPSLNGLVMDLGGGSTQLSWLIKKKEHDSLRMPETGAVSMPYGAAAMTRRLAEAEKKGTMKELRNEILSAIKDAYSELKVPDELEEYGRAQGGLTLYLSGGGFRGWGYVLMSQHRVNPYPIPVINGFKVSRREFLNTDQVKAAAASALADDNDESIFRVSDRRASQVPAVAFLIDVLAEALPELKDVRFCQGGVREGHLFSSLPREVQAQHPLIVATQPFDQTCSSGAFAQLLQSALPTNPSTGAPHPDPDVFHPAILHAFANLAYLHAGHSKDLQTSAALRSTTAGALASLHGLLHESRAVLALLLCARWGNGPLPPNDVSFQQQLERSFDPSPWTLWWIRFLGAVAALIAHVYPAAGLGRDPGRLGFRAVWDRDEKLRPQLVLCATISSVVDPVVFTAEAKEVEKVGKKKRWIGGREGIGCKVQVEVVQV